MSQPTGRRRPETFWAITSYFNPLGYKSRLRNYRLFRQRLALPLITVELGFEGGPELKPGDADLLVQVRGGDVLWQKERLLNLALTRLPDACRQVAWIDCDVLFQDPQWVRGARRVLEEHPIAQPFSRLLHLRPDELPETALPPGPDAFRQSFAACWRAGILPGDVFRRPEGTYESRCTCGMAWIARREVLEGHGFYDAMILGLGDKHLAAAATGQAEDAVVSTEMSLPHAGHYLRWAEGFRRGISGDVGCVDGQIYHLWHGDLANRRYFRRYRGFSGFEFDPALDLAADPGGAWRWARQRPDLHEYVTSYFRERDEDAEADEATPSLAIQAAGGR